MYTANDMLTAQAVLYTPTHKSLLDERQITTGNVQQVSPDANTINKATAQLQQLGFTVAATYPTLSISAPKSLFEKTFNLTFENKKQKSTEYVTPLKKASIPASLKNLIADVVFSEPMEPFV